MAKNRLRIYLLIFLSGLFISACAELGLQSKKETEEPVLVSDCKKNYTKEGIWPFKRVYKTWVRYDPLDYQKGFDTAVMVLKAQGHRATYTDRESGTIKAEMNLESQEQKTHPVDIKLVKEKTSLTVYLSSESASGTSGQECFCGFYEEFEKSTKRTLTASQPKQTLLPSKKPAEPDKESAPAAPPPVATPKSSPSSTPSTPQPPRTPLAQAEVKWASVNLREGPGTNYKVIRTVKKGISLAILEQKDGWLRVRLQDGKEAWISKSATSEGPKTSRSPSPSPSSSPPSSTASDSQKPKSPM